MPLVFICEDNGIGISVAIPKDWIETSIKTREGIHYLCCDGLNPADVYAKAQEADYLARVKKQPVFLHLRCLRLLGHAGSDEGRQSGSISEGLMTLLMEDAPARLHIKRITGKDCFIPLGTAWQYLLPSQQRITEAVLALQSDKREKESGRLVIS